MTLKTTDQLLHELKDSDSIQDYFSRNREELHINSFPEYLTAWLHRKGLRKSDVVRRSNLNKAYVYQIFSGRKYPSRDKVVALAFGLGLNSEEIQTLLKQAGYRELYPRDCRDALLLHAIERGMDVLEANELLFDHEVEVLE